MSLDAASDLIESLLNKTEQAAVRKALVDAGAPDKGFKGVIKGALGVLGKKFAGDALEAVTGDVAEHISGYLGPILRGGVDGTAALIRSWKPLYLPKK